MSNVKISELPVAPSVTTGDVVPIVSSGITYKATISQVLSSSIYTTPIPLQNLTQSLSYSPAGAGTLSILHSGSIITTHDAFFRIHDLKDRWQTTGAGTTTGLMFISGSNGRAYGVDALLMAKNSATTESARWKLSAHMQMTGGVMTLVASDAALSSSSTPALSGTLSLTGGSIILQSTAPTGTWNWGATLRVQELG